MSKEVEKAIKVLKEGGIVIYPTDTAYGIGCRIDDESAIQRLFKIRNRPKDMATPILVNGLEMVKRYSLDISEKIINELINPFWPGALTIVIKCQISKVPELVRGGTDTVGLRMPDNLQILEVISALDVPILGPSANFHGKNTPFSVRELDLNLIKLADYVLEGECKLRKPSTVIDATSNSWKILRQGAIDITI